MKNILSVFLISMLFGCSDKFEDCVQDKQTHWRKMHPDSDYAAGSTANEQFRKDCQFVNKRSN